MTRRSASLGQAAAIVSAGVLLSRLLGVVREQVIGALLGRTVETDLYVNAFTLPDYLYFLLAGGYLAITLVPILTEHHATGDETGLNQSFTAVFRAVGIFALVLLTAGLLFTRPLVEFVFSQLDQPVIDRLVPLTRVAIGLQTFFLLGALFTAAQYAERRFTIPALGPLFYNGGIILGGVLAAVVAEPTPMWFLVGGLIGAAIGSFGLQWWGAHQLGIRLVRGVPRSHPATARYLKLAIPLMVGQTVVALDEQWPRLFGQLAEQGTTAGLNFARRLNMLPVGVIAQAAGVATFPFMARLFSEKRLDEMRDTVTVSLRSAIAVGALATGLIIPIRDPLVRVIYQWGEFSSADTEVVASFLLLFSLSIPFWVMHQITTRAFYAQRRMWLPVAIGTVTTAVVVPILFVLTDRYGGDGIAAGSTIGVVLYAIAITVAWLREGPAHEAVGFVFFIAKVTTAAVIAGLIAVLTLVALGDLVPDAVAGLVAAALGGVGYLGLARLFAIDEVSDVVDRLTRRARSFL
jgi:putative peptidoglycan lipid II flippase